MRSIYYDLEFLEGKQDERIFGIKTGRKTKPTIDIISVGMVDGDGREYYAISKDFNLKEAWNRWDGEYHEQSGFAKSYSYPPVKKYWIRDNVLRLIWDELKHAHVLKEHLYPVGEKFTYKSLKKLIEIYGKPNQLIAQEVEAFCLIEKHIDGTPETGTVTEFRSECELYGYYSAYDHVALCWLFGKMIDLPKGFPMFTIDLKQKLDERAYNFSQNKNGLPSPFEKEKNLYSGSQADFNQSLNFIKKHPEYPKQENEHNALADARWNKKLHEFLNI